MTGRLSRRCGLALLAAGCAFTLAACGGAHGAAASAAGGSELALAQCMRSHGVTNFPDPTKGPGGEGFPVTASPGSSAVTIDGIQFSGPVFHAADAACHLLAGGGGPPAVTEAQRQALFAKAQCLRQHGVPGFPDPIIGPGGHGIGISLGAGVNPDSPAFRQAAKACRGVGASIPHVPA